MNRIYWSSLSCLDSLKNGLSEFNKFVLALFWLEFIAVMTFMIRIMVSMSGMLEDTLDVLLADALLFDVLLSDALLFDAFSADSLLAVMLSDVVLFAASLLA